MKLEQRIRQWWFSSPSSEELPLLDGESYAWLASFFVHFLALLLLGTMVFLLPSDPSYRLTSVPPDLEEEFLPEEFQFAEEVPPEIGAFSKAGRANAEAAAPEISDVSEIIVPVEAVSMLSEIKAVEVEEPLLTAPDLSDRILVKGTGSVGTTGAAGAIDRITNEIMLSLEQRRTLVVWLFDESGSLQSQRETITQRFERVYEELGVLEAAGNPAFRRHEDKPLLTSVASFEATTTIHIPRPTDDLAEIQKAMRAIAQKTARVMQDQSLATGEENVFAAVTELALKFRSYRLKAPRRNVMLVVFTDEAGNDYQQIDAAVKTCRKYEMPVYVVGVPAPFGRREALVKYVDPDPLFDQSPRFVAVDQGPESLMAERVRLRFLGQNDQDDRLDSGFGPFALTRLTIETGGIYFAIHPNRSERFIGRDQTDAMATHLAKFFDPTVMRAYQPDYVTVGEYRKRLSRNKARASLVQAATLSWTGQMENIRLRFPKIDEARLAQDLSRAQRVAAKLEPKVAQLVSILRQGEKDRGKLIEPRWQAGFDLALGRAFATKVRTEGYNSMLALAKQGMKFQNAKNDTWVLIPSDKVTTGSLLSKEGDLAQLYLERVVVEHPDTPWALLAQRELATPFGWEWIERFTDANRQLRPPNNANPPPPRPENIPPRKPKRPVPKL